MIFLHYFNIFLSFFKGTITTTAAEVAAAVVMEEAMANLDRVVRTGGTIESANFFYKIFLSILKHKKSKATQYLPKK